MVIMRLCVRTARASQSMGGRARQIAKQIDFSKSTIHPALSKLELIKAGSLAAWSRDSKALEVWGQNHHVKHIHVLVHIVPYVF